MASSVQVITMGWSYGGYLAARMLMHPESRGRIKGAVAGAPVTHWDGCAACHPQMQRQWGAEGRGRACIGASHLRSSWSMLGLLLQLHC